MLYEYLRVSSAWKTDKNSLYVTLLPLSIMELFCYLISFLVANSTPTIPYKLTRRNTLRVCMCVCNGFYITGFYWISYLYSHNVHILKSKSIKQHSINLKLSNFFLCLWITSHGYYFIVQKDKSDVYNKDDLWNPWYTTSLHLIVNTFNGF
jgi:hypothetical protein